MEVSISHEQGRVPVSVFHIAGDVDSSNHEQLEGVAFQEIDAGARFVLFDLASVPFMSSAGFRTLLKIFKKLGPNSTEPADKETPVLAPPGSKKSAYLKLYKPTPLVVSTLKLAGFETLLDVYEDMPVAIASFHEV